MHALRRYSRFFALCLSLAGSALLSACGNLPVQPAAIQTPAADTPRGYREQIHISGKISVRYQQDSKQQTQPGSFDWEQSAQGLRIALYSPLGQTVARISQDAQGALLERDGQAPRRAGDLDQLINDALGWPLPVAGLRDWLQGFVRQSTGTRQALAAQDQTLEADGWQLRYASWHEAPPFPKRIDLQRTTGEAGEVSLRIFIDQWTTP